MWPSKPDYSIKKISKHMASDIWENVIDQGLEKKSWIKYNIVLGY